MSDLHVSRLWRYPVKSLGGEALKTANLTSDGVEGDRVVHVAGPRGPLTGRTRHGLLTIPTSTGTDGIPRVDGHPWNSPEAAAVVRRHGGVDARLVADASPERFDILNLLVATDGAVERFGYDVRRLRPNILLSGAPEGLEPQLAGRALAIGDALVGVHSVRGRCIVTSIDPNTGEQDLAAFRRIRNDFGGELALNCWVIRPGRIGIGDPVGIVDVPAEPSHIGGWIVGAPYDHAIS